MRQRGTHQASEPVCKPSLTTVFGLVAGMPPLVLDAEVDAGDRLDVDASGEAADDAVVVKRAPEIPHGTGNRGKSRIDFEIVAVKKADPAADIDLRRSPWTKFDAAADP